MQEIVAPRTDVHPNEAVAASILNSSLLTAPDETALQEHLGNALWGTRKNASQTINGISLILSSYWQHYAGECKNALYDSGRHLVLRHHSDVVELATKIRSNAERKDLRDFVRSKLTTTHPNEDELLDKSVDFVAGIMLMSRFGTISHGFSGQGHIQWGKGSLRDFLVSFFRDGNILVTETVKLEKIFNGANLNRIGGFEIVWTDNLVDHLRLADDDRRVYIFHHASFLERQRQSTDSLLPVGLAEETIQTLALLFPSSDLQIRKWFLKLPESKNLDYRVLQCGRLKTDNRKIDKFTFWRDRLVILKQAFDEAQPKTISQWWRDRRNAVQWYTFWVALMVLVLTIFFGLVQSIEGGIQVYASLKQLPPSNG